jgi:hypothetical protein
MYKKIYSFWLICYIENVFILNVKNRYFIYNSITFFIRTDVQGRDFFPTAGMEVDSPLIAHILSGVSDVLDPLVTQHIQSDSKISVHL